MPQLGERTVPTEGAAPTQPSATMLIGEVATATGLTQRTLRYYEEIGLLPLASRPEGGFRLYSEDDVTRLRRIVELKRVLGFSLVEVREMLEWEEERREQRSTYHREEDPAARRDAVARSLEVARRQLETLDSRLGGLLALRAKTEERISRYEAELTVLDRTPASVAVGDTSGADSPR